MNTYVLNLEEQQALRKQIQIEKAKSYGKAGLTMAIMLSPLLADVALAETDEVTQTLDKFKGKASSWRRALWGVFGLISIFYLLWKALDAWNGRGDWKEFGLSIVYVALAGGTVKIAPWAWEFISGEPLVLS